MTLFLYLRNYLNINICNDRWAASRDDFYWFNIVSRHLAKPLDPGASLNLTTAFTKNWGISAFTQQISECENLLMDHTVFTYTY